jgi:hypothetical protein
VFSPEYKLAIQALAAAYATNKAIVMNPAHGPPSPKSRQSNQQPANSTTMPRQPSRRGIVMSESYLDRQ